jgi:three-Cys-motif partner protein
MSIQAEYIEDDGLKCNDVGGWSEEKYKLIDLYFRLFSTGTKYKWPYRAFIDLYAGAGYSRLRNNGKILKGSPLLALSVTDPFNEYILCEEDPDSFAALEARVRRDYSAMPVRCLPGNCNDRIDEIITLLPKRSSLGLCFIDPFNLGIRFETLKKLADRRLDILCLLALHMDANRAYDIYINQEASKVDVFLGTDQWKSDWLDSRRPRQEFPIFLARYFAERMQTLGFENTPTHSMHLVRSDDHNIPKYHLALFSKSQLAYDFWEKARKHSTPQRQLW